MAGATDWRSAVETLKQYREDNVRASEDIVELGEHLITNYRSKLGSESELSARCTLIQISIVIDELQA